MNECPVPGCTRKHPRSHLMCKPHWFKVPKPLRDLLWAAYRSEEGILGDEYLAARDDCINAASPPLHEMPEPEDDGQEALL